jgi:CubicO group peptidase (beta-lactamase class C family)
MSRTTPGSSSRRKRAQAAALVAVGTAVSMMANHAPSAAAPSPPPASPAANLSTTTGLVGSSTSLPLPEYLPAPSSIGEYLPSEPLPAAKQPTPLRRASQTIPATVAWPTPQATGTPLQTWLDDTNTRAFLVVHRGKIAYEWYRAGTTRTTRLSSWSMAKSMVAVVLGQAIAAGKLSLDDRLVSLLPQLKTNTGAYDDITIRDLVDMTSGIDAPEGYTTGVTDLQNLLNNVSGTPTLYLTPDLKGYVRYHRNTHFKPGTQAEYISLNTQILSMVLAKVYGQRFDTIFRNRVWNKVRVPTAGTWNLDRDAAVGGTTKGFCCLNATARDYALLGRAVLTNDNLVSPAWRRRIFTPRNLSPLDDYRYSTGFWHSTARTTRPRPDASMIGVFGQFTYINRATDTVIVKMGDDDINITQMAQQDRIFRSIAQGLAKP